MVESEANFWSEKRVRHPVSADGTYNPRISISGGWDPTENGDFNRPRSPQVEPVDLQETTRGGGVGGGGGRVGGVGGGGGGRGHAGGQFNPEVDEDALANIQMMENKIVELTSRAQNVRTDAELAAATTALDQVHQELMEAHKLMKVQAQLAELKQQMEKEEREAEEAAATLAASGQSPQQTPEAQLDELLRQLEKEKREAEAAAGSCPLVHSFVRSFSSIRST